MKIVVLFGGVSTEHLVSCRSALTICQGLQAAGHEVQPVGITKEGQWLPFYGPWEDMLAEDWVRMARARRKEHLEHPDPEQLAHPEARRESQLETKQRLQPILQSGGSFHPRSFFDNLLGYSPDVVFPAVHGINCEDGVLQGFLEMTGCPYVGCRVLASALGMEKAMAKRVWAEQGLPVVPSVLLQRQEVETLPFTDIQKRLEEQLGDFPYFLKPSSGGSSVGTLPAHDAEELRAALRHVAGYDADILVERFISARELEVAVLGNSPKVQAACVGEVAVLAENSYYDYESKYFNATASEVHIPAAIDEGLRDRLRHLACKAYVALGCDGLARVDFFLEHESGKIYLNEINTLPGFTDISVYPKAWEAAGLALPDLLTRLCELAIESKQERKRREVL